MNTQLQDVAIGECVTVCGYIKGASVYRKKLLAMGLNRGTEITVKRIAPMGDPVEIEIRGFALSLRKDEASALIVQRSKQS